MTAPSHRGEGGWRPLQPPAPSARSHGSTFRDLTRTHALALAGDTLVTLALAGSLFFSIDPGAARGRVALSLLLTMAPFAVVAPFLGPAIDRSRQGRRVMIAASCAARALACLAMTRVLDGLLLFPVAFAVLVLSKSYSVAKSAIVPAAVRTDDELVEANAKLAITGVVAGFLAAVPGLALLRWGSATWTLALAAAAFLAAAVAALRLPGRATAVERGAQAAAPADTTGRHEVTAGEGSMRLAAAAVAMALVRAEVGFLTFLVAFGLRRSGAPSWWFGLVLAASMAATLAGHAVAPRLRVHLSEERIITGALALVASVSLGVARLEGRLWAAAVAAALGFAAGVAKLAFDALVQRSAPAGQRGRSFARFEAGFQLVWVFGALLPVVVATPLRQGYDVIGIAALAAGICSVVSRRRLGTSTP